VLGVTQILAWGSSYYLLAVLAKPIAASTGWSLGWVVGGLSLGLLVAGIVSPRVGDTIQRRGGRLVLAMSAVFLALGLTGIALSPNLPMYVVSWLVLGVGMGAGLYDAAFATLGRLYGQRARTAITTLTLFGGFASTVCWPLSAIFVSHFGWRNTCLIYAGIHLVILLPLYVFALPSERSQTKVVNVATGDHGGHAGRKPMTAAERLLFVLMAIVITIGSMISALLSVHLLTILQARDIGLAAAVALGAIVGPARSALARSKC
jgi:MFS family permease